MHKIPTLKSATARFAIRYPVTERGNPKVNLDLILNVVLKRVYKTLLPVFVTFPSMLRFTELN